MRRREAIDARYERRAYVVMAETSRYALMLLWRGSYGHVLCRACYAVTRKYLLCVYVALRYTAIDISSPPRQQGATRDAVDSERRRHVAPAPARANTRSAAASER